MTDITSPLLLWIKCGLFLLLGVFASAILLVLAPDWRIAVLLALVIWAFCRAYYFMFYVIEHYIDPSYRFSGLVSAARYLCRRRPRRSFRSM